MNADQIKIMVRMLRQKKTIQEVSDKLNIPRYKITRWLAKDNNHNKVFPDMSKEDFKAHMVRVGAKRSAEQHAKRRKLIVSELLKEGATVAGVAKKLGMTIDQIVYCAKRAGSSNKDLKNYSKLRRIPNADNEKLVSLEKATPSAKMSEKQIARLYKIHGDYSCGNVTLKETTRSEGNRLSEEQRNRSQQHSDYRGTLLMQC